MRVRDSWKAALAVMVALGANAPDASAQRAVIVLRHAERLDQSGDSPLSPAGRERATRLVTMFRDAGITAIYSTYFRRTQQTAEPLANALGVTVVTYDATDQDFVATLRERHADEVILVVGHSNTVPALLRAFGSPQTVSIAEDEYTNLFVLVPRQTGTPTLIRLHY